MKALECTVLDDSTIDAFEISLFRVDLTTGQLDYVFTTNGSTDSGVPQILSDISPAAGRDVVDNSRYSYYIAAAFSYTSFTSIGTAMRVYGCSVEF